MQNSTGQTEMINIMNNIIIIVEINFSYYDTLICQ